MFGKINFSGGGVSASNTFGYWTNVLSAADGTTVNILDFVTGEDTGWTITVVGSGINTSNGGVNTVGSGDAAWVDEAKCSYNLHNVSGANEGQYELGGLNNSNTYDLEPFASRDSSSSTRIGEYSHDGFSTVQELDAKLNITETLLFPTVSPASNKIPFVWRVKNDTGYAYMNTMYITENAASGSTALPNDVNQSQVIDNVTLTQQNSLSPADAGQAQVLGNVTLTQGSVLAVDSIAQSQSIDNVTPIQHNALSVNNLTQAQNMDNIVLTVAGVLQVFGLSQAQSLSTATIVQQSLLAADNLNQSQSLDNIVLVNYSVTLTVEDLNQSQNVDAPSLTSHTILSVNNLTQSQLIDAVFLGGVVVGYLKGEISVFSAYNGQIKVINALTGEVSAINPLKIQ